MGTHLGTGQTGQLKRCDLEQIRDLLSIVTTEVWTAEEWGVPFIIQILYNKNELGGGGGSS